MAFFIMIDFNKINFGDTVYHIDEKHNIVRNKITMTDSDGNVWYRYPEPRKEFSIIELIYCGKVEMLVFGEVDDESEHRSYYFKKEGMDSLITYTIWPDEIDSEKQYWYSDREEAEHARIMMVLENED